MMEEKERVPFRSRDKLQMYEKKTNFILRVFYTNVDQFFS